MAKWVPKPPLYALAICIHLSTKKRLLLLLLLRVLLTACAGAQEGDLDADTAKEVMAAFQWEKFDEVIALTESIPPESRWRQVRATALQRRGEQRFFDAKIAESIADFDTFIAIYPDQDPHHWQGGLSYDYAETYEKGKAQFERHQTVNSGGVENAVWHFLCAVRAPGGSVEAAKISSPVGLALKLTRRGRINGASLRSRA